MKKFNFFVLVCCVILLMVGNVSAITNIKPNGDFDLYPNSPIKVNTGWIGNDSTKWSIYYTSSATLHSAQLVNGNLVTITGSDGGINDISIGGVTSSDPTFATWSQYGTVVNASTTYTAFAFMDVNASNAVYFNVRQAYANGTNIAALISSRNVGTGYKFMEYQFTTSPGVKYVRVGMVTRNPNTKVTYYAVGAYQGVSGQLNKKTSIISILPTTSILPNMQPTFTGVFSDIDSDVGICNAVNLDINGVVYPYDCSGYVKNDLFLPSGTSHYNVTVIDLWSENTVSETYSLFVPDIQYVNVVSDTSTEEIFNGIFTERFIYFVVYIAIMVLLQSKFTSTNTLLLFELIEVFVTIILLMEVNNIDQLGGTTQYIMMHTANAYLIILTVLGIRNKN